MSSKTYSQIQIRSEGGDALRPFIRLYANGSFVRNYKIETGNTVVGREYSAGIVLDDRYLSRRHFLIEYDGDHKLYIQDLNSRNGTFVNGQKIQRVALGHGDKLVFGVYEIVISFPSKVVDNVIPFPNSVTEPFRPMIPDPIPIEPLPKTRTISLEEPAHLKNEVRKKAASLKATKEALVLPPTVEAKPVQAAPMPAWMLDVAQYAAGVLVSLSIAWFAYPWVMKKLVSRQVSAVQPSVVSEPKAINTPSLKSRKETRLQAEEKKKSQAIEVVQKPIPIVKEDDAFEMKEKLRAIEEAAKEKEKRVAANRRENKNMLDGMQKSLGSVIDGTDLSKVGKELKMETSGDDRVAMNLKANESAKPISVKPEVDMPAQKKGLNLKAFPSGSSVEMVDARSYQKLIKSKMAVAQHCYADFVGERALQGKVVVVFTILKNGKVKNPTIRSSTLKAKAVHDCIVNELKDMDFETPPWDNYDMNYTFHFGDSKMVDFSFILNTLFGRFRHS